MFIVSPPGKTAITPTPKQRALLSVTPTQLHDFSQELGTRKTQRTPQFPTVSTTGHQPRQSEEGGSRLYIQETHTPHTFMHHIHIYTHSLYISKLIPNTHTNTHPTHTPDTPHTYMHTYTLHMCHTHTTYIHTYTLHIRPPQHAHTTLSQPPQSRNRPGALPLDTK